MHQENNVKKKKLNAAMSTRSRSYVSVAERDGSCFVKRNLKGEGPLWLSAGESHPLPLDHKHLTWRERRSNRSHTK